jgi:hypothetical protein
MATHRKSPSKSNSRATSDDWAAPLSEHLRLTKEGNVQAAREAAEILSHCVAVAAGGRPLPASGAKYLAKALHDIAVGVDANAAFYVKKKGVRLAGPRMQSG